MKTALIDAGGGLRGIYGAGVTDYCMDNNIRFDLCVGVSAGGANIASFCAGQRGRNYLFYTEYAFRKEYMSAGNVIRGKHYLNLDYVYRVLSNADGENPLDYDKMVKNESDIIIVSSDPVTGKGKYFSKDDFKQDDYSILIASSCLPVICSNAKINGEVFFDGGICDPIPIERALSRGCEKIVLVWSRPLGQERSYKLEKTLSVFIKRKYPLFAKALLEREKRINEGLEFAKKLEKEGKLLLISPESIGEMNTLTKDIDSIKAMYEKGFKGAREIKDFLSV